MHNGGARLHARQSGADERVGSQQQVIVLLRTSRLAKIMHGTSFFEMRSKKQADPGGTNRIRWLSPQLQVRLTRLGRD